MYYDLLREYVDDGSKNPLTRVYIGIEEYMVHDWFRFIIDGQGLQRSEHRVEISLREEFYKKLFLREVCTDCDY